MNQFADAYVHHIELILMAHGKYTSKHMDEVIKGLQEKRDKLLLEEDKVLHKSTINVRIEINEVDGLAIIEEV